MLAASGARPGWGDREVRAGDEEGDVVDVGEEEAGGVGGGGAGRACTDCASSTSCSDVLVPAQREMPPSLPL